MRIAVVTETYPPEVNGVASTVQHFVEQLAGLGHEVLLARPRQSGDAVGSHRTAVSELLVRGAGMPRYPGLRFGLPSGAALRRAWTSAPPDVAYIATEGPLGWSALRAARALGIPAASGFHTRFDDFVAHYGMPLLKPVALALLRRFHNAADATLVPTTELLEFLAGSGFDRVHRLERGVDTDLFAPSFRDEALRREWGLEPDGLAVVHVGRIAPEKNLALAVRAFAAINTLQPGARFIVVGDGPARAALERRHPDFVWSGVRRGADLARHYASADLFLFPSLTETFGNVTLESLASGVPVVAYDYGAAREYVADGRNGRVVPSGDADAFVAAAVALARAPSVLADMKTQARAAVDHLSQRAVAVRLGELLTSLATNRRSA